MAYFACTIHILFQEEQPFTNLQGNRVLRLVEGTTTDPGLLWIFQAEDGSTTFQYFFTDKAGKFQQQSLPAMDNLAALNFELTDLNGDERKELFVQVREGEQRRVHILKLTDQGQFREDRNVPFAGASVNSGVLSDPNKDEQLDVVITQESPQGVPTGKLYLNDGAGNFEEVTRLPGVYLGHTITAQVFADWNVDGALDLIVSGKNKEGQTFTSFYKNQNNQAFELLTGDHEVYLSTRIHLRIPQLKYDPFNQLYTPRLLLTGTTETGEETNIFKFTTTSEDVTTVVDRSGQGHFFDTYSPIDISFMPGGNNNENLYISVQEGNTYKVVYAHANVRGAGNQYATALTELRNEISVREAGYDADFNEDGRDDILQLDRENPEQPQHRLLLIPPDKPYIDMVNAEVVENLPFANNEIITAGFVDHDLDGNTDLVTLTMNAQGKFTKTYYYGDGKGGFR